MLPILLLGAGCTPVATPSPTVNQTPTTTTNTQATTNTPKTPTTPAATSAKTIDTTAYAISYNSPVVAKQSTGRVRLQNFSEDTETKTLAEGLFFVEILSGLNDLEYNSSFSAITNGSLGGRAVDVSSTPTFGGDRPTYVTGYFDSASQTAVYVYADTKSGIDAGINILSGLTWK